MCRPIVLCIVNLATKWAHSLLWFAIASCRLLLWLWLRELIPTDMKWMNDRERLDKFIVTLAAQELNSWIPVLITRSLLKFQQSMQWGSKWQPLILYSSSRPKLGLKLTKHIKSNPVNNNRKATAIQMTEGIKQHTIIAGTQNHRIQIMEWHFITWLWSISLLIVV